MKKEIAVEIVMSYISAGWALVLFTTPGLFSRSENFAQFRAIAGAEHTVGLLVLLCALVKIAGLVSKNRTVRWAGLLMSTVLWTGAATLFLIARGVVEFNTGFIVYSGLAVLCLWTSKEVRKAA